jgi:voltage-gated potassium channel
VEKRIKEGRGLTDARHLKGHFVLLGWKPDLHMLVEEILEVNPKLGPEHLVLVNMADEAVNDAIRSRFEGLVFIHGDIIDTLALQRANVQRAAKVIILADETEARSNQEIDARAVMAAMTVKRLAPQAYACAEVLDSKYEEHLRLARCDEVILSRDYSRFMLVSASVSEGVSHVLHDLMNLTHRRGVATVPIPPEFVGRPFGELALLDREQRSASVIAETQCDLLVIDRRSFVAFGDRYPEAGLVITRRIARNLTDRLRRANEDTVTLFTALVHELEERV